MMVVWASLIFFMSLLSSNLIIAKKVSVFEESKKNVFLYIAVAVILPFLYATFYLLSGLYSENYKIVVYSVFFVNNTWFLMFLRNAILEYKQRINVGKYFLWTIVSLLIPISLILFYTPVEEFTDIIFSSAYLMGIFPMTIFVAILLGISVGSVFWGVFASVAFFSIDFAMRSGLIMVIPADYRLVCSELFRAGFIALFSLISLFGRQFKMEKTTEIIKGTKKLNNLMLMLLAIFPVMIFYTAFWQVDVNHKKLQENEIAISQEIFALSIEKLDDYSHKYMRIITDLLSSSSIATAQWKIESYKFSNPEINSGQIITYTTSPFEGLTVITKNGMIEYTSDSKKGWAIKLVIDSKKIYETLPLKSEHNLYVFDNLTPTIAPENSRLNRSELAFSNKYQYAFESQKKLFDKNMEIIMIFQTPPPEISGFTIYFLFFSVLVMVLIWSFYGYYLNSWERDAKAFLGDIKKESDEYRKRLENTKSSMSFMTKDLTKKELTFEDIYNRYSFLFEFLKNNNFQQKPDIALSYFYKNLKNRIKHFDEIYLIKADLSNNIVYACSDGSKKGELISVQKTKESNTYSLTIGTYSFEGVGVNDRELYLVINKNDNTELLLKENEFLEEIFDITKFYIRQYNMLSRNETVFEKTFSIIKLFDRIKGINVLSEKWFLELLGEMNNVLNNPIFLAFYTLEKDQVEFKHIRNEALSRKTAPINDNNPHLHKLETNTTYFEHIAPENSMSRFSSSFGIIPFYFKDIKGGLYFEYQDYRVFSQKELDLFFFIAKTLSEIKDVDSNE